MGSDFYPRLTAAARDHAECNRLVNEQAQISLLLAGPDARNLTFAPLVISIFYAVTFAAPSSRYVGFAWAWRCGCSRGRWATSCWRRVRGQSSFGRNSPQQSFTSLALCDSLEPVVWAVRCHDGLLQLYVWHGLISYFVVRRLTGFRWSGSKPAPTHAVPGANWQRLLRVFRVSRLAINVVGCSGRFGGRRLFSAGTLCSADAP